MDTKLAETLVQVCENNGMDVSLRESYSGRGMYGKDTTGVVINDGDVQDILIAVINNATSFIAEEHDPVFLYIKEAKFTVHNLKVDTMGRGIILY